MKKTKLDTIEIKGKKYTTVDARVQFFREKFPKWTIETQYPVLELDKGVCVCCAVIKDESGKVVSQGHAHEWQSKPGSMVNKTSYVENAETSAVGRALGFMGIGINGTGIATADEVDLAIKHQESYDYAPVEDEIPEFPRQLSEQCEKDIRAAKTVREVVDVYNAYATSEPIKELKTACAVRRDELESSYGVIPND